MLTATVGVERNILDEGLYNGVCSKVIDMGIQYNERFDKQSRKVRIFWEIPGEIVEINGEQLTRQVSQEYTLSLNEKSRLRQMLQAWRGKAFTPEELQGFDLTKILGAGCQLQIIHREGKNGTYANVETVMALPKGTRLPAPAGMVCFDMDNPATYPVFETLPRFIQEAIASSVNFAETGLTLPKKNAPANPDISALPEPEGFMEDLDDFDPFGAERPAV